MQASDNWRIVLIDDEADIREVMSIALEDEGYRVETASDGTSGIALCNQFAPQIVITDIRMPGMDGIQVLKTLKRDHPDIEVIVVTAFGEMELAIKALQLDASDFVTKPINDEALQLALKRARERYLSRKKLNDYTALLEREKAETMLELSRTFAFQKNLIESSMDGIVGCDENETIIIFNKSMEEITGLKKEGVLNRMTLSQLFSSRDAIGFKEALARERLGGKDKLFLYETNLLHRSKNEIPIQISATALFEQGQKSGVVCFFRDLRKIHRLEREFADQARLLHQDKMMSLGRLAASVVHEINNPLSGVLNYIRLMSRILDRGTLNDAQKAKFKQYLDLVDSETSRVSQIVTSLLAFSRKSQQTIGQVRIDELLDRCTILSKHKLELNNIHIVSDITPDIPSIAGDFNQLQQCVINLILNAIDVMPDGGTLTLSASHDPEKKMVTIKVKDNGPGISEKDLPHIFEPFYSTKNEEYGVGLGLSIVYGIMEHHNGSVKAESRPGEGATFLLQLPAG